MTGNQTVSSMFKFNSFICMVRIRTFWAVWIEDLGLIIASPFCYYPSCAGPCYTLYDILLRHRSTLYFCGYDRLSSMDPPCSFVAMTPLYLIWRLFAYWATIIVSSVIHMLDLPIFIAMFCIWTCMCQRSVFSDIYLSFRYLHLSLLILDSLLSPYLAISFIMYFGYCLPV